MEYYKPYTFLYRGLPHPDKIEVSFIIAIPEDKQLGAVDIRHDTTTNTTTLTYAVETGSGRAGQQEINQPIDWDGNPCIVKIIVGSGSGSTGGSSQISSDNFN